ncbi:MULTISPECIES: GNAT family N-acetyltransferase [Salinibaculum]|uniref:GNAT family N-acetyltransferase n=1 Tax=Salinibaculum TaxID=2732368 RepID=UPI0030D2595E
MEVREAKPNDRPAIRDVARRSLQASYSLDPKAIIGAIEEWYDENRLRNLMEDDNKVLLVAIVDDQVVGFSDSEVTGENTAEILWLHIDPDYRGEDIGIQLYKATQNHLATLGTSNLRGRVLADNPGGNAFYENRGLVKVGEEEVTIDGTPYVENVYAQVEAEQMEEVQLDDGTTVYVDHGNEETGSIAPFHVVYTDRNGEDIFGYWCSKCESLANAMDAMGRIQCDECGNARKPTRWDAAYL